MNRVDWWLWHHRLERGWEGRALDLFVRFDLSALPRPRLWSSWYGPEGDRENIGLTFDVSDGNSDPLLSLSVTFKLAEPAASRLWRVLRVLAL